MDVSIIIVSYNTCNLTRNCLDSIYMQTEDLTFEVIVVDNGSSDGSIEMIKKDFPQVFLLENNENLGFGAANNRGLAIAKGKYILYLNSDTVLLNNAIKSFFDYWENSEKSEEIGALGCVLVDEHNKTIHSGAEFPTYSFLCKRQLKTLIRHITKSIIYLTHTEKLFDKYRNKERDISVHVGETQGDIVGADLFLKNNQFAKFDETYFLYCEETDLELKLKQMGYKFFILDTPRIKHLIHKNNEKMKVCSFGELCCQNSSILYAKKNLNSNAMLLSFLVMIDRLNPLLWKTVKEVNKKY